MNSSDRLPDRLYDLGFFLVEAFAAMEVTAVLIANARIAATLGLRDELSSMILNSYLYPLFASMLLALLLSRLLARRVRPMTLFLVGLAAFATGNLICAGAGTPGLFFTGRLVMGIGAGAAFAGQLWTLSTFHYHRIARPLVWGEVGAALGVVAGPLVGALFTHFSAEGWRLFFVLNSILGIITAGFAYSSLRGREPAPVTSKADPESLDGKRILWVMTAWQVAVSILIVGAEYFFSDHLQTKAGKSPLFVGGMTVLASLGAILGSLLAARLESLRERIPAWAALGLLGSLALLAGCLAGHRYLLAGLPIFAAGLGMGMASVSIYAAIVKASQPDQFLSRSMIYLIGMQIGNALGVQAVGLAELRHLDVVPTAVLLAALPATIAVWLGVRHWLAGGGRKPGGAAA